ncbi:efflux RND transporter permease subunit [Caulobacter sp. NIBR1757]|uniref:efflux RND transporter permease subunit n=1 Tax=Caulobacter sp. NIBR1757 TaxID=3016000 RepID=UPI0022F105ED|nr:efflux RND transporter permease subunit [Caulobacter sp. NIBR1757]WGM39426.1 Efflux pump membrane transporter BepE [Caulobacter sp. NIBR1757]
MLSDLSVRRPIFAAVAAIILCVIGLAAFATLPIRELPNVDPPVVSISTTYRGASAEVIEERITQVIERQVSGVQGIDRVNSSSRDGVSRVNITFTLDTRLETAANDVRDAVSRVTAQLPDQADPPQIAKANADSSPIIILNMTSTTLSPIEMADYADRYLVERLSTIPGVATVGLSGAPLYAMRIWLDSDAMAARGLTVEDVETALNSQNVELPAGALESQSKDFTIRVNRGYSRPEDFARLPVKAASGGSQAATSVSGVAGATSTGSNSGQVQSAGIDNPAYVTRLGDIARIEEGPDERRRLFRGNGKPQIGMFLTRQSQANDLKIAELAKEEVARINETLPQGTELIVAVDSSEFTSEAIHEVWITMGIALFLVALVNFVFLGSWRAAIIPSVVAPICLLSTFIVLAPMGFSLNLLTLLALVLSIGLVVDDAIVVVENIQRRVDEGEPPAVAAMRGTRQVFFAVVATTIVLISVFAPLMFLPGYIGRLFVELAVAIASAVAFSALLALSLSPMMASKLLRPAQSEGWLARKVDAGMSRLRTSYHDSLDMLLGWRPASIGAGILVVVLMGLAALLFTTVPQELVPNEDRGRVDVSINGPEGAGFEYTLKAADAVEKQLKTYYDAGEAERYIISVPRFGQSQFNTGNGVVVMKGWGERKKTSDEVAAELNKSLSGITGVRAVASVRGPFQRGGGGGGGGGANVDLIALGNDYTEINRWLQPILQAAQENPGMARPRIDYEPNAPRLSVDIDRDKAAAVGVSAQAVGRVLETMFGSRRVGTYIKNGQEYNVIVQTDLERRRTIDDLNTLYVRSGSGTLVPLSSVVTTTVRGDVPDRPRVDRLRAITLTMQLNPGYTVADAIDFLKAEADKQQSSSVSIAWGGQARDFLEASGAVGLAFGLALLLVFLVLAAQFESWIHPAVIMLTVPLAALGGLFGLLITGSTINTYSQIGLVILIGIAAKNGILIVEFANQMRDQGRSIREAVIEAASLRLRPIIMTSISAGFGALPLVLWAGAGAESRKTIGVVIFFGVMISTMLTLFIVPVFYNLLARFTKSPEYTAKQIEAFEEQEEALQKAAE